MQHQNLHPHEIDTNSDVDVLSLPCTPNEELQDNESFPCVEKKVFDNISHEFAIQHTVVGQKMEDLFSEDFSHLQNQNAQHCHIQQQLQSHQSFHPLTFVMLPPPSFLPPSQTLLNSTSLSSSSSNSNFHHSLAPRPMMTKESLMFQTPFTPSSMPLPSIQSITSSTSSTTAALSSNINTSSTTTTQSHPSYHSDSASEFAGSPVFWRTTNSMMHAQIPHQIIVQQHQLQLQQQLQQQQAQFQQQQFQFQQQVQFQQQASSQQFSEKKYKEKSSSIKNKSIGKKSQQRNRDKNNKQLALDEELKRRNIPRGVKGFCEIHNKIYPYEKLDPSNVRKYLTGARPPTSTWITCQQNLLNGLYDQEPPANQS